jgi:type IV pilus assembly protein PilC
MPDQQPTNQPPKTPWYKKSIVLGGISDNELLHFTKNLAVTLKSGLTLADGLDVLYDQAKGRLKTVLDDVLNTVRSGEQLHTALEKYPKYFTPIYINLVKTGEMAGTLEENLMHLAEQMKKTHELKAKVKSAMMYPLLILVAVLGLGMAVSFFVLPQILPLFESLEMELPLTTKILLFFARLFEDHGLMIALGTFGTIIGFFLAIRQEYIKPLWHRFLLRIPIINTIIKQVNVQKISYTLGSMLKSGISINEALGITADATENRVYRKVLRSCIPEVEKGNSLSSALEEYPRLFARIDVRMVGMGEQTGSLEDTFHYLAEYYQGEVDVTMKNLSSSLEPIMLIVIGVIVGGLALSILGPIYSLTGNVT